MSDTDLPPLTDGLCPLPHLGVLRAQGDDAASFLHNQLTQDVLLLKPDQARLAAWCNAKGRMLASFVLCRPAPDEVLLVCRRDGLPAVLKRLSMFVLRAKVRLSDASDQLQLLGLVGSALPETGATPRPWQRLALADGAQALTLYPALGRARALWLAPAGVTPPTGPALSAEAWAYGDVMSGVAWLGQPNVEAFVPQMLNYESVDGVNFQKGCYPGQEVVARSQFRGTLKRRAFIVDADAPMSEAQEVFSTLDPSQPCGRIAQSASLSGRHVAIAELQLSMLDGADLHLGSPQGPRLQRLPLPYPLRDDL